MSQSVEVVTTDEVPGRRIAKNLGMVSGSSVRAMHFGRGVSAAFRNIVGGEVPEYTWLMAESRLRAMKMMKEEAEKLGADAVVGTRFVTSMVMSGAIEILAYGTAVTVE